MSAYITKIAYHLPQQSEENPPGRLTKKTGILRRHIAAEGETAADLAVKAAEKIFAAGARREEIDFVLFCTQSPDYFLPTTACIVADRLKLKKTCAALDFNLGCSGFVYGLGLAKGLIETGQAQKVLLLTGETYSKYINPDDHATRPLFGDGGAATMVELVEEKAEGIYALTYGTDGENFDKLIVPAGGARHPLDKTPRETSADEHGNIRTNRNLFMDGAAIMEFALKVVPPTVEDVLNKAQISREEVDYYVFHQANHFMVNYLRQVCNLGELPCYNDVAEYGNTVSCSIPIALCDLLKAKKTDKPQKVMLVGFGVGLSWGGCMVNMHHAEAV